MDKNSLPHAALKWTPPGKRKRGRQLGTRRRTFEEEMEMAGSPKTVLAEEDLLAPYVAVGATRTE